MSSQKIRWFSLGLALVMLFSACSQATLTTGPNPNPSPTTPGNPAVSPTPTALRTPLPPSPTPEPVAAKVNNEVITTAEYDAELQRLQAALKETGKEASPADQKQMVLNELVGQTLLAQSARQAGYQLSDAELQKHVEDLIAKTGAKSFAGWLVANFYNETSFRRSLRRSLEAAWQRDQLIAKAPTSAPQVHARQILVLTEDLANRLYSQLKTGADFATLALQVDPDTGGELGWFPRGYLFLADVENAAFGLQPGQYSSILKTAYGYQILFVIERDDNRPLAPDALQKAQRAFLQKWLDDRRSQSQVEIFVK